MSKRGNDGPPSVKAPGNSMMRRLEASPFLTVLAALFVVVFAASGVRLVIPGLREQTRAPNHSAVRSPADRGKRASRRRSSEGVGSGPKNGPLARLVRALVRHLPRLTPEYPQPELPMLVATACGTSLPKRLRWKALGGHGRNGPGL